VSKRYEFQLNEHGCLIIWDDILKRRVNYLPGDVVDLFNRVHELEKQVECLSVCYGVEQRAGMELARKLANL
jgi:hypothetical protein